MGFSCQPPAPALLPPFPVPLPRREIVTNLVDDLVFKARIQILQACVVWGSVHGAEHAVVRIMRQTEESHEIYACCDCRAEFHAMPVVGERGIVIVTEERTLTLDQASEYRRFA